MFYTKYRPQKFSEIIKPNDIADALSKQVKDGKISHAYLFVGSRGTGKTTTARILAKALNCLKLDKDGDPCDKCKNCVAIREGSFIDLIEIDAASNRGIDDIRELKDKIKLAPSMGKNKVYIIDEVHMLTNEAFNALLKTLEEPPKNTTFILCTTELHKVPDTIKSRCQVFRFKRATIKQIVNKLKLISKEEEIKVNDLDLEKIARASLGGFRDAETLLQQSAEGGLNIDTLLSSGSRDSYIEFTDYLLDMSSTDALRFLNRVVSDGSDIAVWTGELLKYLRDLLLIKSGVGEELIDVSEEIMVSMKEQSEKCDFAWLMRTTDCFLSAHKNIKGAVIAQLPVEMAVVEICSVSGSDVDKQPPAPTNKPLPKASKPSTKTAESKVAKDEVLETDATLPEVDVSSVEEELIEKGIENIKANELAGVIEIGVVENKWGELLNKTSKINNSIMALLKSGKPVRVEGKFLILQVFYAFHKERLESPKNRKVVENIMSEVYEVDISVKCELSNDKPAYLKRGEVGVLTDKNLIMPTTNQPVDKASLLASFDGALPL